MQQRLFGITQSNLNQLVQHLQPKVKNLQVLHYDLKRLKNRIVQKKLKNADLIIADSTKAYSSALFYINRSSAKAVVILDNPILLYKQDNIILLDCQSNENILKYEFANSTLDYAPLLQALKSKQVVQPLQRSRPDLIAEILKSYTASGLLDKFNTFVYAFTTPTHRTTIKLAIVQFIFGAINEIQLKTTLEKYIKLNPKCLAGLQVIIDYMTSQAGLNMQKALAHAQKMENEASKNTKRKIAYKKLANMYNVDQFELNNIILLYRGIK